MIRRRGARAGSPAETAKRGNSMGEISEKENDQARVVHWYAAHRPDLIALAYRMLGSLSDAEDVVQELFASLQEERLTTVSNPRAYLAKAVARRCLNVMKSAARRKVSYVGQWLPEPWTASSDSTLEEVERRDDVSYAFMVMMERLTPLERAVVVLREGFGCEYAEIAGMLEKTEAACRKLLSRARNKLGGSAAQPAPRPPREEKRIVQRWAASLASGSIEDVLELIAEDAVLVTDGGGKVRSAINPIYGRMRVAALLRTISSRRLRHARLHVERICGSWGIMAVENGRVTGAACFDWNEIGRAHV